MKLYRFLFDQLYEQGVGRVFGLPGDFVLNLYQALEDYRKFRLITFSHEPAVGFAADASTRITNELGVCCVTYGAGERGDISPILPGFVEGFKRRVDTPENLKTT